MNRNLYYLIIKIIIKIIINKIFYIGNEIGMKSAILKPVLQILKRHLIIISITIYLFWFILAVLFQVFFHHINLPQNELNFLIILYVILLCLIQTGNFVSNDIREFALESNFSLGMKKKIIIINEYLGFLMVWIFLLVLSFPLFIVQTYYNNYSGFILLFQIFILLFFFGFMLTFIKFILFMFSKINLFGTKRLLLSFSILSFCILLSIKKNDIQILIETLVNQILYGNMVGFLLKFIPSNINLYEVRINIELYLIMFISLGIAVALLTKICDYLFKEKHPKSSFKRFPSFRKKMLYIFFNFLRCEGLINIHFLVTFTLTFILLLFAKSININALNILLFTVYILTSNLFNHSNIVLLCKRNKLPFIFVALCFSFIVWLQYIIIIILLVINNMLIGIFTTFTFMGLILIFSILTVYCASAYQFEKYFDDKSINLLGKSIVVVLFVLVLLIKLFFDYLGINSLILNYLISFIISIALLFVFINNYDRIRGNFYEGFK
ncbi:hypothetical protein [Aeribacillus alveayuensis]|uniref:Uncharacterized protein n=1 Tax=Aeribacillus alveayuensis TaxID=279215 RepID=A0ABT9VSP2_9BACI|nr:hypothetical protein [Bacillus alveayuensis]